MDKTQTDVHISRLPIPTERNPIVFIELIRHDLHRSCIRIEHVYLIRQQRHRPEVVQPSVSANNSKQPVWRALPHRKRTRRKGRTTYTTSVKNIFPLVGCTFTSFKELNCRPKKLSKRTVVLCGGDGFTRTTDGGRVPRPDVVRMRLPLKGPVPPFVIWIVSGRSSYKDEENNCQLVLSPVATATPILCDKKLSQLGMREYLPQ